MSTRYRRSRPLLLLPLLASILLLLPACTPSTPPPPTSTRAPTTTPIPWPTLDPNRPNLAFSPLELPEAILDQSYEVTITVANDLTPVFVIRVDNGELPPGLALNYEGRGTTATITGTPTKAGEFEFELVARCKGTSINGQEGYQTYMLLVKHE